VGLTKYHAMKTCWRRGGIAPHILNLGTKWRWVVCQLHVPAALSPEKSPRYPLDRRLGGTQSQSEGSGKDKKFDHLACRELNGSRTARSPQVDV
jgi:hypothetical protein